MKLLPLVENYFKAWIACQQPEASAKDIEHDVSFLASDAVWQHLPYAVSDKREKGGNEKIQKGMMKWLGAHEKYQAKLLRLQANNSYILIEFTSSSVINTNGNEFKFLTKHYIDILEMDNGKVGAIRRYDIN